MGNLLLIILGFGILAGQIVQLPVFGVDAPLVDLAVGASLLIGGASLVLRPVKLPKKFWSTFAPFILLGLALTVSLVMSLGNVESSNRLIALLYLARMLAYLSLPLVLYLVLVPGRFSYIKAGLWLFVAFALLGFFQMAIFPDFGIFEYLGWDPHQGRLLSTFLDPNFAGIWLAFGVGLGLAELQFRRPLVERLNLGLATALLLASTLLTASRSALVAIGVVILTVLGANNWRRLGVVAVLCLALVFISPQLQSRLGGIWRIDQTAAFRLESWESGLHLWRQNIIFGVGYNTLTERRYEQALPGTVSLSGRSEAGFDSSLLTIAATSGILGLGAFLWLLVRVLVLAVRAVASGQQSSIGYVALSSTAALLLSSWFVNAWLYGPILLTWLIIVTLLIREPHD